MRDSRKMRVQQGKIKSAGLIDEHCERKRGGIHQRENFYISHLHTRLASQRSHHSAFLDLISNSASIQ
jgi:hypothetical protein